MKIQIGNRERELAPEQFGRMVACTLIHLEKLKRVERALPLAERDLLRKMQEMRLDLAEIKVF